VCVCQDVNLTGSFLLVKAAARQMVKLNKGGRIISIGSANALIASAGASAYCGGKAGLNMMVRCWAQDLVPFHITVNAVNPGAVDTALMRSQVDSHDAMSELLAAIPSGRMASSEEIGWAVAYFSSPQAEYVTGSSLLIDGGLRDHTPQLTPGIQKLRKIRSEQSGHAALEHLDNDALEKTKSGHAARTKFNLR